MATDRLQGLSGADSGAAVLPLVPLQRMLTTFGVVPPSHLPDHSSPFPQASSTLPYLLAPTTIIPIPIPLSSAIYKTKAQTNPKAP